MKITRKLIPEMTLEEFADKHGLELEVCERRRDRLPHAGRFYAMFARAEVMDPPGFLSGVSGDGDTEEEAIRDYAERISEKRLAIYGPAPAYERTNIDVPRLTVER